MTGKVGMRFWLKSTNSSFGVYQKESSSILDILFLQKCILVRFCNDSTGTLSILFCVKFISERDLASQSLSKLMSVI